MATFSAPPAVGDIWYRATVDRNNTTVHYDEWVVVATTPRGIWVSETVCSAQSARRSWYSLSTRRISRTKGEALERLIRRTGRWVTLEQARLATARARYAALTSGRLRSEPDLLSVFTPLPFAYGVK